MAMSTEVFFALLGPNWQVHTGLVCEQWFFTGKIAEIHSRKQLEKVSYYNREKYSQGKLKFYRYLLKWGTS